MTGVVLVDTDAELELVAASGVASVWVALDTFRFGIGIGIAADVAVVVSGVGVVVEFGVSAIGSADVAIAVAALLASFAVPPC